MRFYPGLINKGLLSTWICFNPSCTRALWYAFLLFSGYYSLPQKSYIGGQMMHWLVVLPYDKFLSKMSSICLQ
jgi:hypothetical protein